MPLILFLFLLVVVIVLLMGSFPRFGYRYHGDSYNYAPVSTVGIVLVVLLVLLISGAFPWGWPWWGVR